MEGLSDAEREALARALKERVYKRATLITAVLRKFMSDWNAAYKKEQDAARAAALARAEARKRGRRARKPKPPPKKDPKKKGKPPLKPVAEAWFTVLYTLDELIHKHKKVTLEDMYRGAEHLQQSELVTLRNILATANKKVLPKEMNLNQMAVKQALWAASAAHEYHCVDRPLLAPVPALAVMRDKGVSMRQLFELGFRESELLRVGFGVEEVLAVSGHEPARLRAAGLSVKEVVGGFGGAGRLPGDLQGFRGVQKLRAAGYSAAEMVAGGIDNAWDLRRAGFSASEVISAGVPPEALRPAGFGLPELRPPSFLGPSFAVLQDTDPRTLPPAKEGTRGGIWPRLLQPQAPAAPHKERDHSRNRFANMRMRAASSAASASTSISGAAGGPSITSTAMADSLNPRVVAWPDNSGTGGPAVGGALPPAPNLSRMGSLTGTGRGGA
ncbi:hypothetical protein Agub_g4452 [Astrephomene gubernaculifera]|uniref:Uncharacterized protein n=1 Tax=Astrephomene gubernaculifera TaxID=47775 RepID=A0AAD3DK58_9CHLO|nr:hypothetical protein Agub_g4452 [Astrephomene gubernaculifera]